MNNYFEKIYLDRLESAKVFEKPSMNGFNRILRDMYAEKAHFIFELIQNADDAEASEVRFILQQDHLLFIHNGKIKFTVSDPETEAEDSLLEKLGHINSICSVGNTTKKEQKIGKFGIGFKSIFQYTDSPIIVDDDFSFEIRNLFVPHESDYKVPERNIGETLFYIPFNKQIEEDINAYEDIKIKFDTFPEQLLLFLNHLKTIRLVYSDTSKLINLSDLNPLKIDSFEDSSLEAFITNLNQEKLLICSKLIKEDVSERKHKISIVFPLNQESQIISEHRFNAFCFFPTSEATQLKFMIHAPFLLTDNRQNIKKGNNWNQYLIDELAVLLCDSLVVLRDNGMLKEEVFDILPIVESDFKLSYYEKSIFYPFYSKLIDFLKENEILPTKTNTYSSSTNACLVRGQDLIELLETEVLNDFLDGESMHVVFPSITEHSYPEILRYCTNDLDINLIRPEDFVNQLIKEFISKRSDEWLIAFYKYCNTRKALWNSLKNKPIIRLTDGTISEPYRDATPIVFLEEVDKNFPSIKSNLLEDKDAYDFFLNLGLGKPEKRDLIFRVIVHRYYGESFTVEDEDLLNDFRNILLFYFEASKSDLSELIEKLKEVSFLVGIKISCQETGIYQPSGLYLANEKLNNYFSTYQEYIVFDEDFYKDIIEEFGLDKIKSFLLDCGVSETPRVIEEKYHKKHPEFSDKCKNPEYTEYKLEGFNECLTNINFHTSLYVWDCLSELKDISRYISVVFRYQYYSLGTKTYNSELLKKIRTSKWLFDRSEKLVSPLEITLAQLHPLYNILEAMNLIKVINFKEEKISSLSADEEEYLLLGKTIKEEFGLTLDELRERLKAPEPPSNPHSPKPLAGLKTTPTLYDLLDEKEKEENQFDDLNDDPEIETGDNKIGLNEDSLKRIEKEREQKEIELLRLEELQTIVNNSSVYSFAWFKALLELEYFGRKEAEISKNPIRIKFNKIEIDNDSNQILILHTNEYIPLSLEDNSSLQLILNYSKSDHKTILIDAVSRQKKSLKAKVSANTDVEKLYLNDITDAVIEVRNANFILENLRNEFVKFGKKPFELADQFNFRDELSKNIKFIYGPPGTGKTTELARQLLHLIRNNEKIKILALCPTNKAADVLTNKLLEIIKKNEGYIDEDILVRFGLTNDQQIEESVYTPDKLLNKINEKKLILITTVARFPYDVIKIKEEIEIENVAIKDFDWEYLVFDEASMINLPSIVFALYYSYLMKPYIKFIVSGNPFQIGPIVKTNHEYWKDGNIYTMVNLDKENSFVTPKTQPHNFEIQNLSTQFRSIPQLGKLFSDFTYGGILKHSRPDNGAKKVRIKNLNLRPITIIDFEVNAFENLYRPHRLKGSPFQIYSAVLVIEFTRYILDNIEINDDSLSIGIICPYRAQQNIIDKLLSSHKIPENISLNTGTLHTFQGDECDLIMAVLNPPARIENSSSIFLNKQNIINVAISRAKDNLILFCPVDNKQKVETNNLFKINKLKKLISSYDNGVSMQYTNDQLESIIYGNSNVINELCFSTSHQDVNVYTKIEKKYEIRYDENAVDIQVRS